MTVYHTQPEVERELVRTGRVLRRANAFFLANLSRIVDIARLREGDDEEDYFIEVPASQLHEVGQRIADLELSVSERFGVGISAFPIPVPG
jgi:hypothetical protein